MVSRNQWHSAAMKAVNDGFAALKAIKKELNRLDRRVSGRRGQLKRQGAFSEVHAAFLGDVAKRQVAIRKKIDKALERGMSFALLRAELERDFNGLSGQILRWEERLDACTTKARRRRD